MKKLLKSRLFAIICLIILVYCVSIHFRTRIALDFTADFILWSPYYLISVFVVPISILIPLKYFPTSKYSKYIFRKEKELKTLTFVFTGFLLFWFFGWFALMGIGELFAEVLHESEAIEISKTYIKNDSIVNCKIGEVVKIEEVSHFISNFGAQFYFIVHGTSSNLDISVMLTRDEKWIVDTLIID